MQVFHGCKPLIVEPKGSLTSRYSNVNLKSSLEDGADSAARRRAKQSPAPAPQGNYWRIFPRGPGLQQCWNHDRSNVAQGSPGCHGMISHTAEPGLAAGPPWFRRWLCGGWQGLNAEEGVRQ
jgi:hypothetical protein